MKLIMENWRKYLNEAQTIDISGLGSNEIPASVADGIASGKYIPCTESCPADTPTAWKASGNAEQWAGEQINYVGDLSQQLYDILDPDEARKVFATWLERIESSRSEKEADRALEEFKQYVNHLKVQ